MIPCVGSVELGGTKTLVVAGRSLESCSAVRRIETTTPDATMHAVVDALNDLRRDGWAIEALGVASFGPVGINPSRSDYGRILSTPKPGWSGASVLGPLADLGLPMAIETDVNAAAIAEGAWGAAQGLEDFAYVTCGTGLGAGLCVRGEPIHGAMHPEAGHVLLRRAPGDTFAGCCPWHGDCAEGLASGPAIAQRVGGDPRHLPDDHPVWALAGSYLGQFCATLALVSSCERIVLGGGVGARPAVLTAARSALYDSLAGYLPPTIPEAFLVAPGLEHAGLGGGVILAQRLLSDRPPRR